VLHDASCAPLVASLSFRTHAGYSEFSICRLLLYAHATKFTRQGEDDTEISFTFNLSFSMAYTRAVVEDGGGVGGGVETQIIIAVYLPIARLAIYYLFHDFAMLRARRWRPSKSYQCTKLKVQREIYQSDF
jgi:hypothetical protein